MRKWVFFFLIGAVFAQTFVVNDTDWRCVFLAGYYAELTGQKFYAIYSPYINIPEDAYIISCGEPVINKYDRVYSGYTDLMFSLPEELDVSGPALVVPESGKLALMVAPYAFRRSARIYFLNNKTLDRIAETEGEKILVEYKGKTLKGEKISVNDLFEKKSALMMSGRYLYLPANPGDPLFWTGFRGKKDVITPDVNYSGKVYLVGPELGNLREKYDTYVYAFIGEIGSGRTFPPPALPLPLERSKVYVESVFVSEEGNFAIKFRNEGVYVSHVRVISLLFDCGLKEEIRDRAFSINDVFFLKGKIRPPPKKCKIEINYVYGPDERSLDNAEDVFFEVVPERVDTNVELNISEAIYGGEKVYVWVKNLRSEEIYVQGILRLLIDGKEQEITSSEIEIPPYGTKKLEFKVFLRDADIVDNERVTVFLNYGKRMDAPIGSKIFKVHMREENIMDVIKENAFVLALIFLILALVLLKRSA